MGTVLALSEPTPDTNRPAAWTQYNDAADLFDRELVASPAYAAKEPAHCNLVARMIAGERVLCGHARTCAECPANLANATSAPSASHAVTHTGWLNHGKRGAWAPLREGER